LLMTEAMGEGIPVGGLIGGDEVGEAEEVVVVSVRLAEAEVFVSSASSSVWVAGLFIVRVIGPVRVNCRAARCASTGSWNGKRFP
jgi:hypothetical protein